MGVDVLGIAVGGLGALQQALATTGHNIANVASEDYSRQETIFAARQPQRLGDSFVGSGVSVVEVRRVYDDFIIDQVRTNLSTNENLQSYSTRARQIDSLISDPSTGVSPALQEFFSALNGANEDPSYVPSREVLYNQTILLISRMQSLDNELSNQLSSLDAEMSTLASQISTIGSSIATLNSSLSGSSTQAADLLDQRDALLKNLSKLVNITAITQDDGSVNVFLGTGQSLVLGGASNTISYTTGLIDPSRKELANETNLGTQRFSEAISGGKVGGLLTFREQVISSAQNFMGRISLAIGDTLNTQHLLGMDINGNLGARLFNDINATATISDRVIPHTNNSGTGAMTASITTLGDLTTSDYDVSITGSNLYAITRKSDSTVMATGSIGTLPDTVVVDGVTLSFASGTFSTGDSFKVVPTRNAVADMAVNITNSDQLALAAPIIGESDSQNSGNGVITSGVMVSESNAAFTTTAGTLTPPVRIEFLTSTTYRVLNDSTAAVLQAGPIPFSSNSVNTIFPVPAITTSSAGSLVDSTNLEVIASGELTVAGTTIGTATAGLDTVSTTDNAGSAIAIAATINLSTSTTNVTATVNTTTVDLGAYTAGEALTGTDLTVNGTTIDTSGAITEVAMINAISAISGVAAANVNGSIIITATDGRNIQVETDGTPTTATFANFDLTGVALDKVQRSTVTLTGSASTTSFAIAGTDPADGGFTANTYSQLDYGYRVNISGAPASGDIFTVNYNSNSAGDNRNGLLLAEFQNTKILSSGTSTFQDSYGQMIADIATKASQARVNQEASASLLKQSEELRDSISGVNIDEEAAALLQFEQTYQAIAQIIGIARSLFDVMIATFR